LSNQDNFEIDTQVAAEEAVDLNIPEKCPSCGRANTERRKRCACCCALTPPRERITVRAMNLSTIVLFIAALVYFVIAVNLSPQYTPVSGLDESMNFQHVRILAKVRYISEFKDKYQKRSTIQLELEDSKSGGGDDYEGRIKLKAEGEVARELKEKGLMPARGDVVDVSATLFAGKGYRTLSLGTAELLKVVDRASEAAAVETDVKSLIEKPESFKNKKVKIKEAVIKAKRGKLALEVSGPGDAAGTLVIFGVDPSGYKEGQKISASGLFIYYERGGYWELKITEDESDSIVVLN
jgi:hypothetical protein